MYSFSYASVCFCMLPNLHTGFSRGRSGGLVFAFLSEFSTVYCDPVKGFGIVNKAEIDAFLELSCFFADPLDVGNLISGSSAFYKPAWTSGISWFMYCWSLAWRSLSITLLVLEMSATVQQFEHSLALPFFGTGMKRKISADDDCSHEIKPRLLLGRKVMTNQDSILESKDISLPTKSI